MDKTFMQLTLGLLGLCWVTGGWAQTIRLINEPVYRTPFVVVVAPAHLLPALSQKIEAGQQSASFALVNGDRCSEEQLCDSINTILNSDRWQISKQYVYFVVAGERSFFNHYSHYTDDFFAAKYYLKTDDIDEMHPSFTISDFESTSIDEVVRSLRKKYTWDIQIETIREQHAQEIYKSRKHYAIGFKLGSLTPYKTKIIDSDLPRGFTQYGLYGLTRFGSRWQLNWMVNANVNLPNPRSLIQEQIQEQVDFFEILSGGGGEEEIDINAQIRGHVYLNATLEGRFLLKPQLHWQPYIGLGISFTNLLNIDAKIDTTITIDFSDFSGGSGGFNTGGFEPDSDDENFNLTTLRQLGMPISVGVQHQLGRRWELDISARYDWSPNREASLRTLGIDVGLAFRLVGRKQVYYEYVRLNP